MGIELPTTLPLGNKPPPEYHLPEKSVPNHAVSEEKTDSAKTDLSKQEIEVAMDALINTASILNRRLKYSINEEIGRVVVQVIDAETDRIIKEIPPRELQRLIARIKETLGLLVDEKI